MKTIMPAICKEVWVHRLDEIAPDLFRIAIFVPEINLQFNHFLVRDEQPLLSTRGECRGRLAAYIAWRVTEPLVGEKSPREPALAQSFLSSLK